MKKKEKNSIIYLGCDKYGIAYHSTFDNINTTDMYFTSKSK